MSILSSPEAILTHVQDYYDCVVDHPFASHPQYTVLRHRHTRTWFGLLMRISEYTLGVSDSSREVLVLNLKVAPEDVDFLRSLPGFAPAYHMNKTHWISVILDGTVMDEQVEELIATSYALTE